MESFLRLDCNQLIVGWDKTNKKGGTVIAPPSVD
jgi:hypothetical protein